jgi:hypothetical protein
MGGFSSKGTSSKNEKAVMAPGPEVNAVLAGLEVNDKGDMIFTFRNESGSLAHREFNIDPSHSQYVKEYADSETGRIKHIACAFLGAEAEAKIDAIEAPDFKAWAGQVKAMIDASPNKGTALKLKVVVNKKNFASLPLFPDFISSEVRSLSWVVNPKYDKFEFSTEKPDSQADTRDTPVDAGDVDGEDESF